VPRWLKIVLLGVAALAAAALLGRELSGPVSRFAGWVQGLGPRAPLAFVLGYAAATTVMVPASLLTLAAGALFGVVRGTVYSFVAATLGATLAFLIARYAARPALERRARNDERFHRIDRAIGRRGLRVVFLLRLSPVLPFTLLNYALGLTSVRLRDYLIGSIGMLPGTLLYVYSGRVVGDVAALAAGGAVEHGTGYYSVLGLGLVATVVATVLVTRIARHALDETAGDPPPAARRSDGSLAHGSPDVTGAPPP
jgi:uncharacterized membrane protein YdjX (TVP38/TMEM64 family)